jgi:hypothetical protein
MGLRPLLIPGLAAALGAVPAHAATWAPPMPAGEPAIQVSPRTLGFDGDGRALLGWRGYRSAPPDAPLVPFVGLATRAPAGSTWTRGPTLSGRLTSFDIALYGRSRAGLGAAREDAEGRRSRSRLVVAFGRSTGSFGRQRVLARGPSTTVGLAGPRPTIFVSAIKAGRSGDATLLWVQSTAREGQNVRVSLRGAGGTLSAPRTLRSNAGSPALAMSDRGDRLVVWRRGTRIEARRRLAGRDWGPVERVGETGRYTELRIGAALTATGRAVVAWTDVDRSLQGVSVLHRVAARTLSSGWRAGPIEEGFRFRATGSTAYVTDGLAVETVGDRRGRCGCSGPAWLTGRCVSRRGP